MVIPTADNSFFSNLVCHAEKHLSAKGYHVMICSSGNDAEKEKGYLQDLVRIGAAGIIDVSGLSSLPDGIIPDSFPLVWVDRIPASRRKIPWVANDDAEAMELAADYLLKKGCRNILLAPGYLAENRESPRVIGYRSALLKAGIADDEGFILKRKGIGTSEAETEELVLEYLHKGGRVDGIITSSDRAAFGALSALRSVGLYVPEDVKLISFDNSPFSAMADPSITSLDRKPLLLAEKACSIMESLIRNEADIPMESRIPVSLIERVSTR